MVIGELLAENRRMLYIPEDDLPKWWWASRELLSLPIFAELSEEEIDTVAQAVVQFMERVRL